MIGSHDSFTYLNTGNIIIDFLSIFWRCQTKSIREQYDLGVRVFDIRVINSNKNGISFWRIGHGLAKLKQTFDNLENICLYFKNQYPNSYIRIMLETGAKNTSIRERFEKEANDVIKKYGDMIWTIYIKNPWICLYRGLSFKEERDTCCHLFNWHIDKDLWANIKSFKLSYGSIKNWAKKNNPIYITNTMKEDKDILYFMDYIGVHPKIK